MKERRVPGLVVAFHLLSAWWLLYVDSILPWTSLLVIKNTNKCLLFKSQFTRCFEMVELLSD